MFWRNINPTQINGQFADMGSQYRTAIFYHSEEQRRQAELSKEKLQKSGRFNRSIATEIVPAAEFYPAEDYHQEYYKKSPDHYKMYRYGSGREHYINEVWGKEPAE